MPDSLDIPPGATSSIYPSPPVEVETIKNVSPSETKTGVRYNFSRSKAYRLFTLSYNLRDLEEFELIKSLWENNYPRSTVTWTNSDCGISNEEFYLDSFLKAKPDYHDLWSYSLTLRAKNSIAYVLPADNILPFTPEWGHEVEQDKKISISDSSSYARKAASKSAGRRKFKLGFTSRDLGEIQLMEDFWCHHYPSKNINLNVDLQADGLHLDGEFRIVSSLQWSVSEVSVSYKFDILEV